MNRVAITRDVSPTIERCELTHLDRAAINHERAIQQHQSYQALLRRLGVEVLVLPALEAFPDSVFVEDVALVFDEVAVLTRPGALSRRGEVSLMEPTLREYRELRRIGGEGTLDGGDVVVLGKEIIVGLSGRSNEDALHQLSEIMVEYGYAVRSCGLRDCLHLKSAVTVIDSQTVLLNPDYVLPQEFAKYNQVCVDPEEPAAANILQVGEELVFSDQFPKTLERLRQAGIQPHTLDNSEFLKAEGALTCCSLILRKA